jgi:hypothetical protein
MAQPRVDNAAVGVRGVSSAPCNILCETIVSCVAASIEKAAASSTASIVTPKIVIGGKSSVRNLSHPVRV